jgi:excisionase family DNA binding protein
VSAFESTVPPAAGEGGEPGAGDGSCPDCGHAIGEHRHDAGDRCAGGCLPTITNEAALAINVGLPKKVILAATASGRLSAHFVGDRYLIHFDSVRAWLLVPHARPRGAS